MIVHLEGTLVEATPLSAVLDLHGVGYGLAIPVTTAERLPALGQKVRLFTHVVYREDAQTLYGFATPEEREWFRLLSEHVSGIGPKIALSILSKLSIPMLRQAIAQEDVKTLSQCPGIGAKTAARLCVELKDKVAGLAKNSTPAAPSSPAGSTAPAPSQFGDAVAALITLGYKLDAADKAVRQAQQKLGSDASTEALIMAALR
ncbi:MAG: Holliday junction branch migration protein RuvA [Verrucomicrobiota bacterium JB022]|nr:Holliday junction branch migration protein RuvA [Verrucomicrobiota bacterium JB022]